MLVLRCEWAWSRAGWERASETRQVRVWGWQSAPKSKTKLVKPVDGATFTLAQIDAMDKTSLQTMLQKYGLPTSGRIDKLKERLAEVAVK